jgi:hypothetical protein
MSYQRRMIHFAPRTVSQTATNSPVSTMTARCLFRCTVLAR